MAAFLALRMSAAFARLAVAFLSAFFLSLSDGLRGGAGTGLGSLSLLTFLAFFNFILDLLNIPKNFPSIQKSKSSEIFIILKIIEEIF